MAIVGEGQNTQVMGQALAEASKMICALKCGRCPLREETFRGCPSECTEDTRPWQCWMAHFLELAQRK